MDTGFTVEGLSEITKKLSALEPKVAKKIQRTALRDAAKVVQQRAKLNATVMIGGRMGRIISQVITVRKQRRKLPRGVYGINVILSGKRDSELITYSKGASESLSSGHKLTGRR